MSDPAVCGQHVDAIAGWRCDDAKCKKHLCGKCTAHQVGRFYCVVCGQTATQLTIARTDKPFTAWLARAAMYPLGRGAIAIVAIALVIGIATFVIGQFEPKPGHYRGLALGITGAFAGIGGLIVLDISARGSLEAGFPLRLARAIVATAVVWAPAALYLIVVPANFETDKLLWLVGVLALVHAPIAAMVAVTDAGFSDATSPFRLFELGWQVGRHYLRTLVAAVVLGGLVAVVVPETSAGLREAVAVPGVSDFLAALPLALGVTLVAYLLGTVPHVHGLAWGWRAPVMYEDPLYPQLVAEGPRKVIPASALAAPPKAAQPESIGDPKQRSDARAIAAMLKQEDLAGALKLYQARPTWDAAAFDDRQLIKLGRAAHRANKPDLAKRMLEEAVERNGRSLAHALLALAQLVDESLAQPARARELYRRIVLEHSGSDAARVAKTRLQAAESDAAPPPKRPGSEPEPAAARPT